MSEQSCVSCRHWWVLNELNGDGVCRYDIRVGRDLQNDYECGLFPQIIIPMPPLGIVCTRGKPREYPKLAPVWKEWGDE